MRGKFLMLVGAAVDIAIVTTAPRSSSHPSRDAFRPAPPFMLNLIPLPSKVDLAVAVLREARYFSGAQVGYAGQTPEEVWAWRVVLNSDQASQAFFRVFVQGTTEAKMFALAGLSLVNRGAYRGLAGSLRLHQGSVRTAVGCVAQDQPLSEVLSQIDDGSWIRHLLAGGVTPLSNPRLQLAGVVLKEEIH